MVGARFDRETPVTAIPTPPSHPFDPTADPRRHYADAARRHLATAAKTALLNGSNLIVIVGEQGAGKSSLLFQLAEQVTAGSGILFAFPQKILACKLDVAPGALAKLIQTPGGATGELRPGPEGDSAAVLLLDDADHLSDEVIQNLLEQQEIAAGHGLSLIIVATVTPSPATGPYHKAFCRLTKGADPLLRLEPFSPEDAGRMIRHRLETSRCSEPNIFTPEAIDRVARTTGGNPGKIIGLCRTVMDTAERDHCYPILSVLVDDAASRDRRYRAADADPMNAAEPINHRRALPAVPPAMPMSSSASPIEPAPSSTPGVAAEKHSATKFYRVKTLVTVAIAALLVAASAMIYLFAPESLNPVGDTRQQRADREDASTTVAVETVAGNQQQDITEFTPERTSAKQEAEAGDSVPGISQESADPMKGATSASPDASKTSGRESQPSAVEQPEAGRAAMRADTTGQAAPKTEPLAKANGRSDQPAVVSGAAKQSGNGSSKLEGPVAAPTTEETLSQGDGTSDLRTAPAELIVGPLPPANAQPETDLQRVTEPDTKPDSKAERKRPPMDPDTLIARGDKLLSAGDLASARLVYRMAVTSGSGRAARFVGRTYDPLFFESAGISGTQPSASQAAEWYRKAAEMGDDEGALRLEDLISWLKKEASKGDAEAIRALAPPR